MTSSDPDVIRRQIEDTRHELGYDVDALNEKVNPSRVASRRMSSAKGRMNRMKEKVMGTAQHTASQAEGKASQATDSIQHAASSAASKAQQAPSTLMHEAQGNPLAAGLIAFGVGWLASSLMPPSQKEKQLAQQTESKAKEHKDALMQPAKQAGKQMEEQLKPAAQHAMEEVKSTAKDAASAVTQEGKSAAHEVQGQAQQSKQKVQSQTSSS
jgi:hypothetical protein